MLVIKIFSRRKKVFRERKKCEKIHAKRNQATIQDSRVIVQQVQRRQGQSYTGNSYKGNATSSGGNNAGGQERVVKCYNYQAQEAGQILDEEQLAFLADPGIPDGQVTQITILNIAAF
ncbi:hypothetical protein Tco_0468312 [Tanacetum coccineum]